MKELPILLNFEQDRIIGHITIKEEFLPDAPLYTFALGYRILEAHYDEKTKTTIVDKHEPYCVSIVNDRQYYEYLKKEFNE